MPTALIVGASRGLGRALVEEHLARGWAVIATVRDPASLADLQAKAGPAIEVVALDVTDWPAVDVLGERMEGRRLDLLFVNAGVSGAVEQPIGAVDPDEFVQVMLVNALAPLRLIDRLADRVAPDGTLAAMSSGLGSIADNDSGGWETYRISKAALDMGLRSLAARLGQGRRSVLAVNPGWVRTDMGGPHAPLSIEQSIPRLVDMLERRHGRGECAFVSYDGRELPW